MDASPTRQPTGLLYYSIFLLIAVNFLIAFIKAFTLQVHLGDKQAKYKYIVTLKLYLKFSFSNANKTNKICRLSHLLFANCSSLTLMAIDRFYL